MWTDSIWFLGVCQKKDGRFSFFSNSAETRGDLTYFAERITLLLRGHDVHPSVTRRFFMSFALPHFTVPPFRLSSRYLSILD
jgi:hypothetical protein